jgi:hypothetical protein
MNATTKTAKVKMIQSEPCIWVEEKEGTISLFNFLMVEFCTYNRQTKQLEYKDGSAEMSNANEKGVLEMISLFNNGERFMSKENALSRIFQA